MGRYVFVEMEEHLQVDRTLRMEVDNVDVESGIREVKGVLSVPNLWTDIQSSGRTFQQRVRSLVDDGGEFLRRTWRRVSGDANGMVGLARRNLVTACVVLLSGIFMWEISVDALRRRAQYSIVFPVDLPHAVTLAMAAVWRVGVAPGNLCGLYLARLYMMGRGLGYTSVNTTVLFVICVMATAQSHLGAYYLRKCLCKGRGKSLPTIDTVRDAVWFLVIISLSSFLFATVMALCVTLSPLVKWRYFWEFWSTWWLGILSAMVTITPLIIHLVAWKPSPSLTRPAKIIECVVTACVSVGIMSTVFLFNLKPFHPMPYLCVPLITYSAFRFNRVGWAFTVTAIAFFSASGTIRGLGAVEVMSDRTVPWSTSLLLQAELFSVVMGVVSITLAAAVTENKSLTRKLHQMNVELECTVDSRTIELRRTNEELQISQKQAEMASHAKSDFLANMSHEIRTPIHGILGLTALLLESELTGDQEESLVSVKECADVLLHIINSVLDLAKIEAGRLEVERVPFDIRKMVSTTFRIMEARAHECGLKLLWDVDGGVPRSLVGDVGKLQQCMLNLVGNALKFTHQGSISVHVSVASDSLKASMMSAHDVTPTPQSMLIHFEIRDTGIGISKDKLKDMFKPFTQADASTSRLYGGTGLGLCIVHRFVELLDGLIWVESEVGNGSTFHFCLPLFLDTATSNGGSAEASPRATSPGNVYNELENHMDGFAFSNTGPKSDYGATEQSYSGPQSEASTNMSRAQSTSDLQEMFKGTADSITISIDEISEHDAVRGEEKQYLTHRNGNIRPCHVQSSPQEFRLQGDSSRLLGRRASGSDYEAHKELQRASRYCPRGGQSTSDAMELVPSRSKTFSALKAGMSIGGYECTTISPLPCGGNQMVRTSLLAQPGADRGDPFRLQISPSTDFSGEMEKVWLGNKPQLKILLAEDNLVNQKIASRQLLKHGHVVTIVGDGQQALDMVCAHHDNFDLVLMDVQMPNMDGLSATEQIRNAETEKGWSRVPILGLTAHAIQGYQETCLGHGMDGYLGKPFDIQQLLKTIGHLLPWEEK